MKTLGSLVGVSALCVIMLVCSYELLLRVAPHRAPEWYMQAQPLHGIDLWSPGVLARTPIDGVPLPMYYASYAGPPYADLLALGLVDASAPRPDASYRVDMSADALGLPNASEPDRVDVVLAGDSFAVMASDREPPGGLQARLEAVSARSIYNLGVSGAGPAREAWLLEHVGLAKQPAVVVWLFYAGNDVYDAAAVRAYLDHGIRTHADLFPEYRRPWSFALDVLGGFLWRGSWPRWLDPAPAARADTEPSDARTRESLPGLRFEASVRGDERVWFHPLSLRYLMRDESVWLADPGWAASREAILRARAQSEAAGARFVLVYVPSKPEVMLPFVQRDDAQLHRMATFDLAGPHPEAVPPSRPGDLSPAELAETVLAHRRALARVFDGFCREEGFDCVFAGPLLEGLAASGVAPYMSADTHWNRDGQATLVAPLAERLR